MNRGRHRKKTDFYNISSLPAEIKQKMIKYQVMYGNKPDLEVFKKDPRVGPRDGGFSWSCTKEGFVYWNNILGKRVDLIDRRIEKANLKILSV